MIIYKGKLTKITELEDAKCSNNVPVGEVREGEFLVLPKKDSPFCLGRGFMDGFVTSKVSKIESDLPAEIVFKTLNSTYKLEYEIPMV